MKAEGSVSFLDAYFEVRGEIEYHLFCHNYCCLVLKVVMTRIAEIHVYNKEDNLSLASVLSGSSPFQCFHLIESKQMRDRSSIISEKGCLRAGEEWIEGNFLLITMSTLALASVQVLFITSILTAILHDL